MTLIEFTGIPGSGKTYLCRTMAERLRARGLSVSTPFDGVPETNAVVRISMKLSKVMVFALTHTRLFFNWYYTIARTGQSSVFDTVRSLVTLIIVDRAIEKSKRTNVILLLDQGIVQSIFTILYAARKNVDFGAFAGLYVPDILVEVDSADDVIRSRLLGRKGRQSRMETDGARGIERARLTMALLRKTTLYDEIPIKRTIRNDGPSSAHIANNVIDEIVERIHHDV